MAYAHMASLAMNHEDAAGVARWAEKARAIGADEVHVLNSVGTMEFLVRGGEARATAERSLELATDIDDVLRAYANLSWAAIRHRELALAVPARQPCCDC